MVVCLLKVLKFIFTGMFKAGTIIRQAARLSDTEAVRVAAKAGAQGMLKEVGVSPLDGANNQNGGKLGAFSKGTDDQTASNSGESPLEDDESQLGDHHALGEGRAHRFRRDAFHLLTQARILARTLAQPRAASLQGTGIRCRAGFAGGRLRHLDVSDRSQ